jgi:hypothetical protein
MILLFTKCYSDQVKEDEIGGICSICRGDG